MPVASNLLYCVAIVSFWFDSAEAIQPLNDRDRAFLTYNEATDPCRHLHAFSHEEEKDAANSGCEAAFLALDRLNANTCHGWRKPNCRFFHRPNHRLCSCIISTCNWSGIRIDETKSFSECALDLWTVELSAGGVAPSLRFQETYQRVESDAVQAARSSRNVFATSDSSTGCTSYSTSPSYGIPASSSQYATPSSSVPMDIQSIMAANAAARNYVCQICETRYLSKGAWGEHMKSHTTQSSTYCTACKRNYSTPSNYQSHVRKRHSKDSTSAPGTSSGSATQGAGGKVYICDICGREYKRPRTLFEHKETHTKDIRCRICNRKFLAQRNLDAHAPQAHPGYEAVALGTSAMINPEIVEAYNALKPFPCGKCPNRYESREGLRQHTLSHTAREAATCTICHKTYSTPYVCQSHMRSQHK